MTLKRPNIKNKEWLISGILSVIVILIIFGLINILPWQENSIFSGDLREQCIPFTKMFLRKLFSGSSLLYSNEYGMGGNTSLLYAFYSLGLFNIPYIFIQNIYIATLIMYIMRFFCASAFFSLFGKQVLKSEGKWNVFFSVIYSLSACAFSLMKMPPLMEGFIYLPLVLMLTDRYIKTGKKALLTAVFALLFVSQFYCGFVTALTATGFTICELIIRKDSIKDKSVLKSFCGFALCGITAALIAGILLLPAGYYALNLNGSGPQDAKSLYYMPLAWFYPLLPGRTMEHDSMIPYLYCGIITLPLIVLYFADKTIRKKERIAAFASLFLVYLSFFVRPLYNFMHLFNEPNAYTHRHTYVCVFILCAIALKELHSGYWNRKKLILSSIGMMIFEILLWLLFVITPYGNSIGIEGIGLYGLCIGLILYPLLITAIKTKSSRILTVILFIILLTENVIYDKEMVRSSLYIDMDFVNFEDIHTRHNIDEIRSSEGYAHQRIKYNDQFLFNAAPMYGFESYGYFSSSFSPAHQKVLKKLGLLSNGFEQTNDGSTPIFDLLSGVGYQVTQEDFEKGGNDIITVNDKTLPIGYAVSGDPYSISLPEQDPFNALNTLTNDFTGFQTEPFKTYGNNMNLEWNDLDAYAVDNSYKFITNGGDSPYLRVSVPHIEGRDAYFYLVCDIEEGNDVKPVNANIRTVRKNQYMSSGAYAYIVPGEHIGDNDIVELKFLKKADGAFTLTDATRFAYLDPDALDETWNKLSEGALHINNMSDGHIEGSVDVSEGQNYLFFSITYEEGWEAYVDGQKAEVIPLVEGAFTGVRVTPGHHDIVLDYKAPMKNAGCISFFAGILLLILFVIKDRSIDKAEKSKS